jgi:hypothetical protein
MQPASPIQHPRKGSNPEYPFSGKARKKKPAIKKVARNNKI